MKLLSPNLFRRVLPVAVAMAVAVALPAAAQTPQEERADSPYLIYLPSQSPSVDQESLVQALDDLGFNVITLPYAAETRLEYARRVAAEVRALTERGVVPGAITVLGAGTATSVAILTSAVAGKRQVNYVLLGQCDPLLKVDYRFRMSGRVLGLRDSADAGSQSCRPLWSDSPKVSDRRDLVVSTGYGAALFDRPRAEWLQPVVEWTGGGRVDVGEIRIGAVQNPAGASGETALGAGN